MLRHKLYPLIQGTEDIFNIVSRLSFSNIHVIQCINKWAEILQ